MTTGHFVWRENCTPDMDAAEAFYGAVIGWKKMDVPMPGDANYTMFAVGEQPVCGVMPITEQMQAPPCWMAYVGVDDVDAIVAKATEHGGTVIAGPMNVGGGMGRMAVFQDPQGGVISVWKSLRDEEEPAGGPPSVGQFCWEQLNTADVEGAVAFYPKVFGWEVADFHGTVTFKAGDAPVASVIPAPEGTPPHWLSHVMVDDLDRVRKAAAAGGGTVLVEAIPVPTLGTFAVIQDPNGAVFSAFAAVSAS